MTAFRYIFMVFIISFVFLSVIYLRRVQNNAFYRFRICQAKQTRLKQQLWQQQMQLDFLVNPASIGRAVRDKNEMEENPR